MHKLFAGNYVQGVFDLVKPSTAEVLDTVNAVLVRRFQPPIAALPRGVRKSWVACPLAKALGTDGLRATVGAYPVLQRFVRYFDDGAYPELDLDVTGAYFTP